jgi:hypothetical protein
LISKALANLWGEYCQRCHEFCAMQHNWLHKKRTLAPQNASKVSFSGQTAELRRTCEIQA